MMTCTDLRASREAHPSLFLDVLGFETHASGVREHFPFGGPLEEPQRQPSGHALG